MPRYKCNTMPRALVLASILMIVSLPCFSGKSKVQPQTFGDSGISLEGVQEIAIFDLELSHTRGATGAILRKRAAAKLTIRCGASCMQSVPKILVPLSQAKETAQCPRLDKILIVDFDDAYTIEFYRGGTVFRFRDKCFVSEKAGTVLMGIFNFY